MHGLFQFHLPPIFGPGEGMTLDTGTQAAMVAAPAGRIALFMAPVIEGRRLHPRDRTRGRDRIIRNDRVFDKHRVRLLTFETRYRVDGLDALLFHRIVTPAAMYGAGGLVGRQGLAVAFQAVGVGRQPEGNPVLLADRAVTIAAGTFLALGINELFLAGAISVVTVLAGVFLGLGVAEMQ